VVTQFGYAFLTNADEIAILDMVLHTPAGTIDTGSYGSEPIRGAISPDGNWLYASLRSSGRVMVIDTAANTRVMSITVGRGPHGIAFSNSGAHALVVNQGDGTMSVIDTVLQTAVLAVPVGSDPYNVATGPCLGVAYLTNKVDDTVSVYDFGAMTITQVITGFSGPRDLVVSPYGHHVYVTNQHDGTIGVINTADDTLFTTWDIGGDCLNGIDVSPDGSRLYVAENDSPYNTYVVDTTTGQVSEAIYTGSDTWDVEVFLTWAGNFAYVSVPGDGDIKVLDKTTDSLVGNIILPNGPRGLAFFPARNLPPVAVDDTYSTTMDVPLNVPAPGVLGNDVDINGDSLTEALDTALVVGVLDLSLDGSFTFTPTVGWSGLVTFTYIANDGVNDSNVATVTITVDEVEYETYLPLALRGAVSKR
jgi:YVTN family beta-propeller protein